MTSRPGRTVAARAVEQPLRSALLGVAHAVETGDLDALARWCVDCCTRLLSATAAALVDLDRAAAVEQWRVTATTDSVRELIELDLDLPDGGCRDCLETGRPTTIPDLSAPGRPWEEFATHARALLFTWTHAQPLRLHGNVIGSLHLLGDGSTEGPEELDTELAHALAALALAAGVQQHALDMRSTEVAQLHTALDSRLVIEQAKGVLAARHHIDVEEAFLRLRRYARDHRRNIHHVAREVVQNRVPDLS